MRRTATLALLATLSGCGAAKPILRQADDAVEDACTLLARAAAAHAKSDPAAVIAATCAVEAVTRTMREMLLSQQIQAAKAAGVAVPEVNSGALERDSAEPAAAE